MTIAWIDLETSGLATQTDLILEVGVVITDDKFVEIERKNWITDAARHVKLHELDPVVQEMHLKSGLWQLSASSLGTADPGLYAFVPPGGWNPGVTPMKPVPWEISAVDGELRALIARHGHIDKQQRYHKPQVGGSTCQFDRMFMARLMPRSTRALHHRNVDVSTLNEMARRVWPKVYEARPRTTEVATHRALADLDNSIACARYYATALEPMFSAEEAIAKLREQLASQQLVLEAALAANERLLAIRGESIL